MSVLSKLPHKLPSPFAFLGDEAKIAFRSQPIGISKLTSSLRMVLTRIRKTETTRTGEGSVILRNTPFLVYHRQSRGNTLADDWVTLEVESDQIRLIGKILEDTIRIFPGWYPKQVKMTDWIVTVKYSNYAKRRNLADHLTPDTSGISTDSGGGFRNEYSTFISALDIGLSVAFQAQNQDRLAGLAMKGKKEDIGNVLIVG
ncbi:hypothetical protein F5888DRAFT_1889716 [Russula emetica]|nr:hypothetical protein F5888DRAFT_1889716 [Russula emetica]